MAKQSSVNEKNLTKEILRDYNYFEKFLTYLPDPDALLLDSLDLIEVYKEMLLDAHIFSKLDQLKKFLLAKDYYIEPTGNKKIDDFVNQIIESPEFQKLIEIGFDAYPKGYSVAEVIYKLENGYWIPQEYKFKKQELFRFDADGNLVYVADGSFKKIDTDFKVIVFKNNPLHPYGEAILNKVYWPWLFKKAGLRFWIQTAEKYSVPTILALFQDENIERAQKKAKIIGDALANVKNDAALALANVDKVDIVDSKGKGDDFKVLLDFCNMEISKAITGEILTSDVAKTGTYAQAKVQQDTFQDRANGIAETIASTITKTLISWVVRLNFGKDAPVPNFYISTESVASWEIIKDAIDRGIPLSKEALYKSYVLPAPKNGQDEFINPKFAMEGGIGFADFLHLTKKRRGQRKQ